MDRLSLQNFTVNLVVACSFTVFAGCGSSGLADPDDAKCGNPTGGSGGTASCVAQECKVASFILESSGLPSYDWDRNGVEEACPGDLPLAEHEVCVVSAAGCTGSGYLPNPIVRGATDVNKWCGSNLYINCVKGGNGCLSTYIENAGRLPCH